MGPYPLLLPTAVVFLLVPVVLMIAPVLEPTVRRRALLAAVGLLMFCGYGLAKTYADHYEWRCVVHHADVCPTDGVNPGPVWFEKLMALYFG
jgi:hypothetical protein